MKYRSLLWGVVTAVLVGLLPPEPAILVRVLSYLLGIGAGVNVTLFLIQLAHDNENNIG